MLHQRFARSYWVLAAVLLGFAGCAKTDPPVAQQPEPAVVAEAKKDAKPVGVEFDALRQPARGVEKENVANVESPKSNETFGLKKDPNSHPPVAIPAPLSPASDPKPFAARGYVAPHPTPDSSIIGGSGRTGVEGARYKQFDQLKRGEKIVNGKAQNRSIDRLRASEAKGDPGPQNAALPGGPQGLLAGKALKDMADGERYDDADFQGEAYQHLEDNAFKTVKVDPLSTLSAAVDTAAYSNVRSRLNEGMLPPKDMVRIADFLNYFPYDYAAPTDGKPVNFKLEMAACPWNEKHNLLKVGLKSKVIEKDKLPARNLVFLIDTSGSMNSPNRLPLVIESMKLLVEQLTDRDRVSIVTYAGAAGLRLPPTPGNQKEKIINEIIGLQSGGSTNGEGGIKLAYEQAEKTFIKEGINRVILATDGDFNVGVSDNAQLIRMIEDKRKNGVYLTILGYGMGNLHDDRLEQLAHHGNGHYAYIDSLDEAKKLFVEQGAALVTVAKDVKLQIEFNPAKIAGYRLIGYENRILKTEDFRNDAKDAGDMGCGHTCTMLFEIVPVGEKVPLSDVEPLKYQTTPQLTDAGKSGEWLTTRMRYKDPETDKASEVSASFDGKDIAKDASKDFRFAAAVAAYGMLLRDSDYVGNADLEKVLTWSKGSLGEDKGGHRAEFTRLVEKTKDIVTKKREQVPQEKK
ncbi:vWA domain-containing protein [Zavarzinella formosa]|uniref:vWA domain-containing protein n=1 Tax=Zavarzinella formosa TaxID=360055 RepID=UPI000303D068|nr:VWA domain-containing protein [Zavarzinella formosa]